MSEYKYTQLGNNLGNFMQKISYIRSWHAQFESSYRGTREQYEAGENMLTYCLDMLSELHRYNRSHNFQGLFTKLENDTREIIASLIKFSTEYRLSNDST